MQIRDIQSDLEKGLANLHSARALRGELEGLQHLAFRNCRPEVTIHYTETHKKIRDDADASYFDPQTCEVVIRFVLAPEAEHFSGFEPPRAQPRANPQPRPQPQPRPRPYSQPQSQPYLQPQSHPQPEPQRFQEPYDTEEALNELLDALQRAERERRFVGIKWFRDRFLPEQGFSWAQDPRTCGALLRSGTEQELVVTHQVTNPRNPQHPVTALRLNRDHPRFRGESPRGQVRFKPVRARGGLAQTVTGGRR